MKRIIIPILLFSSLVTKGQIYQKISTWEEYLNRFRVTGMFRPPLAPINGADTGALYYNKLDTTYYKWTGNAWRNIVGARQLNDSMLIVGNDTITIRGTGGGGGADSSVFATKYGVDTAKANIRDLIATKLNISDTTNKWINDIKRSNDSVFAFKNGTWQFKYKDSVGTGGGGALFSDLGTLSETKIYSPAQGVASSSNVANYSHTSVDSARYKFSTTRAGSSGSEYGGWLAASTSGDSIKVTAPFWVVFGDSQAEGHPGKHGRLHPFGTLFLPDWPDSIGQLSYHLRDLTNMRWYNHGIGGQTTVDCRIRFFRDVVGVNAVGSNDSRGNITLSRKPEGVVIIAGINDVFNGVPAQTTKDNLEWMASVCQQYDIRCVILNLPGDAITGQTYLQQIASINKWLGSGVMDQYGACVVDYNSWWNDPAYGNDNIHHTSLIVDDIHPSAVGYDSLANYIYRKARLTRLTKALFINELDPAGFTGYSRPAGITINSSPYTISAATDLININTYVPDSVWIKVTSSTNVTGTTYSGLNHIEWFTDNNPLDSPYYTKRTQYSGSQKSVMNTSKLFIQPPTLAAQYPIDVYLGDGVNRALQVFTNAGGGQMILNGMNTSVAPGTFSVYGGGAAIWTDGNITAQGSHSIFGNALELNKNIAATTTGYGISYANTNSAFWFQTPGNTDDFLFDFYSTGITGKSWGTTPSNVVSIKGGYANVTGSNQIGNGLAITTNINQTTGGQFGNRFRALYIRPNIISATDLNMVGIFQKYGNNYFNVDSPAGDSTCFGCDSAEAINAKFRVKGSARFDLGSDANYDIYYRNSSGLLTRLAAGTDGYVLTTHSTSSAPTWTAPGATVLKGTTNWTPGVVAAGSSTSTTITVTGAAVGDPVTVSKKSGLSNGEIYDASVTAPDTVTLRVHNVSTGSANYSSAADYNVVVLKY